MNTEITSESFDDKSPEGPQHKMTRPALPERKNRMHKLTRRMSSEGLRGVSVWATQWLYWNAGLHFLAHPPSWEQLGRAFKYRRRNKKYGIQDPIIVYQMGKVGSTSVHRSLLALDLDVPVYKVHFLNCLDVHEAWLRQAVPDDHAGLGLIHLGREIRSKMRHAPRQKWNLISLVRAPIPRGISGFFQNLSATYPPYREQLAVQKLSAKALVDYFVTHYYDRVPEEWFDLQVKAIFGIDVYASEFPKLRGFEIYEQDNFRLLVIRLEDLNRCGSEALTKFLNIPNFQLINKNVGEKKGYGSLYSEFVRLLKFKPEHLALWHNCQYARHFYTPEELAQSVQRWT